MPETKTWHHEKAGEYQRNGSGEVKCPLEQDVRAEQSPGLAAFPLGPRDSLISVHGDL